MTREYLRDPMIGEPPTIGEPARLQPSQRVLSVTDTVNFSRKLQCASRLQEKLAKVLASFLVTPISYPNNIICIQRSRRGHGTKRQTYTFSARCQANLNRTSSSLSYQDGNLWREVVFRNPVMEARDALEYSHFRVPTRDSLETGVIGDVIALVA